MIDTTNSTGWKKNLSSNEDEPPMLEEVSIEDWKRQQQLEKLVLKEVEKAKEDKAEEDKAEVERKAQLKKEEEDVEMTAQLERQTEIEIQKSKQQKEWFDKI